MKPQDRRDFLSTLSVVAGLAGLSAGLPLPLWAAGKIKPAANSALIVVDVQNCFVTGGTLPVTQGEDVVPVINRLSAAFDNIVVTQDCTLPATRHLPPATPARSRSRPPSWPTAPRCCGPTTACKAATTPRCTKT